MMRPMQDPSPRTTAPDGPDGPGDGCPPVDHRPLITPLYRASYVARYGRQERIQRIEAVTGRSLICYIGGPTASITRDDVLPLVDLLQALTRGVAVDLLLHTPGGDIDATEKMALMLRKHVGPESTLRVIVPDQAKSAGTLLVLSADSVVMSDSSELGPLDPRLVISDAKGTSLRPAQSYVDGFEAVVAMVNREPEGAGFRQLLDKYDPTTLDVCRKVLERSSRLAHDLLEQGMFRAGGDCAAVARELSDNRKWLWHGAPIDHRTASRIGLVVTYLDPADDLWQQYWGLYCEQRLALTSDNAKLFESDYVSLALD